MDIASTGDISSLDPELLQLPEFSPLALKASPQIAEHLFAQWLSLPDTSRLVKSLIDEATTGTPSNAVGNLGNTNAAGSNLLPSMFPAVSTPPLSPRSSSGSPRFSKQRSSPSLGSPLKVVTDQVREVIPQFYFHNGRPPSCELKEQCLSRINDLFDNYPDGLQMHKFRSVTKEICKLPIFFAYILSRKIDTQNNGIIKKGDFIRYWVDGNMLTMDTATLIFNILKNPNRSYLSQVDFKPILHDLLSIHPGLEFLKSTPEFQERYAETVTYRIFYHINRAGNGRLTLRELKRGNLIAAMQHADEEEDINKVLRIFSQVPRKFTSKVEGKMGYEDFVYFMLSEEDKSSEPSLEYWFKCIDLDGNGVLTFSELQFFYEEQLHRMECISQEPVQFEDVLCQIVDMISPEKEGYITLCDLKRSKLSGHVFNILFNLNKFIAFESRDPFTIRQEREDSTLTEWDRYAHREYIKLSMEEDGDASHGSIEVWEGSLEAPF